MGVSDWIQDIQSGLTVTLVSVPTSVAYASLAGLPGIRGLTKLGPCLIVFGMMTRCKWLSCGATSLTAVTVKADLEEYGLEGDAYVELVCLYSLLVGVASIMLAALRLGAVAKAIPKPVMSGFKWGAACVILFSQLPDCVLGAKKPELKAIIQGVASLPGLVSAIPGSLSGSRSLVTTLALLGSPHQWRLQTAALSATTVWFIKRGKAHVMPSWAPPGCEVLLVCVLATAYSAATGYSGDHGASSVIGPNPAAAGLGGGGGEGLGAQALQLLKLFGPLYWSQLPWGMVRPALLLKAVVFSAVDFSATVAICATFEQEDGLEWDANRELAAQGVANLAAGVTGCQPVGGSLSRSLVTRLTGACSPRAAVVNGAAMMLMLPVLGILQETPRAVLAAIVLSQILGTILDEKGTLRTLKGLDALLGLTTAAATALTSPTFGILIGCLLALAAMAAGPAAAKKTV